MRWESRGSASGCGEELRASGSEDPGAGGAATGQKDDKIIPPQRGRRREWENGVHRGTLAEEDADPKTDVNRRLIPRHVLPPLPGRDARDASIPSPAPPAHPPRSSAAHETRITTGGRLGAVTRVSATGHWQPPTEPATRYAWDVRSTTLTLHTSRSRQTSQFSLRRTRLQRSRIPRRQSAKS
jgi:hypothetical protein